MFLSDVSIKRPVFATMLMGALLTLGAFSYSRLAIDQWPDITFPFVVVQTPYPGASPETVERDVTRKIEETVNPIQGVKELTSSSLEGLSTVFIEFDLGTNAMDAQQDVRSKIDQIREELPEDIETPLVLRFDPQEIPIVSLALSSETRSMREMRDFADETLRQNLEAVEGVGQVTLLGGEARAILVEVDPDRLAARSITVPQVMQTLRSENMEVPAGRLEQGPGEKLVRVAGRLKKPGDFEQLVVAVRDGVPVRLGDVARVVDSAEEARTAALVNGKPAIGIDLRKVSGANTVEVADGVKEEVERTRAALPEGMQLSIVRDNSVWIEQSVEDVKTTILLGGLLTVLVVFTFLNSWRSTVITGLTLPVSVIASFLAIYAFGFTLNMMTLMALSLAIGILIDDAIVVRENIVRHVGMGQDHREAARKGTSEIGLAVLATTMSTLCVFVPVAFMGGIVGRFFREFGVTVACAVAVSLFVSFTLDPMLSSVWYDPVAEGHAARGPIGKLLERFNHSFVRLGKRYRGVIGWALTHRFVTLGIAVLSFVAAMALFPLIGGTFMPNSDNEELAVVVTAPVGSTLSYTTDRVREVSALVRQRPEVAYTYETIAGGFNAQVNEGEIYVKLTPKGDRDLSQQDLSVVLRSELEDLPGVEIAVLEAAGFGGSQKPLEIFVSGANIEELRRVSNEVLAVVRNTPGAIEAESSLEEERPEVRVDLNRDLASQMGVGIGSIAQTLRPAFAGEAVSRWEDPNGEQHDVIVRLPGSARESVDQLAKLPIPTGGIDPVTGAPRTVPLGQIAAIAKSASPQEIDRREMQRVVIIRANFYGRTLTAVSGDIMKGVSQLAMPTGYSVSMGGETEMFGETVRNIVESMILAIIFIYLVLASEFGSFLQPLAIMLSVPLSMVGVLIALLLTGTTFNIMSMIGLILLMGLVTKNAILLIDFTNQGRERGLSRRDALIDAGEIRLRPIVMTTLAMIFGMMPLAFAIGAGAEFRAPMARAVIGGLITSTLLTLVVVPVVYTLFDDFGNKIRLALTKEERQRREREEEEESRRAGRRFARG
ncbi:MAG: efflux RND transporter permease subunit [Candidatus Eisenbacteria bacterium]|nr:efflux RND transporter permease subunit [Candidatus Eisenbacteria bacterium]